MSIKTARMLKNMTQKELAQRLKISRTTVSMWESGESLPRADRLSELSRILDCGVEELLKRNESA